MPKPAFCLFRFQAGRVVLAYQFKKMILQIVIADSLLYHKRNTRSTLLGRSHKARTPVRVVFGDPKRNCEGYGLCKVDLGEDELTCRQAKIEYGILLSERGSDTFQLVLSKGNWDRYATGESGGVFTPQFLNLSLPLAQLIGLKGTRVLVEPPSNLVENQ